MYADVSLSDAPMLSHSPDPRLSTPRHHSGLQIRPRLISPVFDGALHGFDGALGSRGVPTRQLNKPPSAHNVENTASHPHQHRLIGRSPGTLEQGDVQRLQYSGADHLPFNMPPSDAQWDLQDKDTVATIQQPIPCSTFESISKTLELHLQTTEDSHQETQNHLQDDEEHGSASKARRESNENQHDSLSKSTTNHLDSELAENPLQDVKPQNSSRPLASSLNALAPDFKVGSAGPVASAASASTRMRPTAPSFSPVAIPQRFAVAREFSFSSGGPSFNAHVLKARTSIPETVIATGTSNPIFSAVEIPPNIKPTKRSKAIPILRPRDERSMNDHESEVQEDESGRIIQAEGRQKRLRLSSEGREHDGRSALLSETEQYRNTDNSSSLETNKYEHSRQNSGSLEQAAQAANQLKEIIDDLSASEGSSNQEQAAGRPRLDGRVLTFRDVTETITFDTARPRSSSAEIEESRGLLGGSASVKHAEPTNEQFTTCGSTTKETSRSEIYSAANGNLDSRQVHSEAEPDTLNGVYTQPLSIGPSDSSNSASRGWKAPQKAKLERAFSSKSIDNVASNAHRPVTDGFSYIEPSYEEIDAVMKHLDNVDLQDEVVCSSTPPRIDGTVSPAHRPTPYSSPHNHIPQVHPSLHQSKHHRGDSSIASAHADNHPSRPSSKPSGSYDVGHHASHIPSGFGNASLTELDGVPLSGDQAQLFRRRNIHDNRINDVIDNFMQERLAPLERSLVAIQSSLVDLWHQSSGRARGPTTADRAEVSDADDEDDTGSTGGKPRSPVRRRKSEKLRVLIGEIIAAQKQLVAGSDLGSITASINEIKTLLQESQPSSSDLKSVVEEAIGRQMRGRSGPVTSSHQSATAEKKQLQIAGLESMLKIAEDRAEDELKARRATEDALADSQRLLRLALQDAAEQRESAEETERSLSAFHEERHEALRRTAMLEGVQEGLQRTVSELAEKNGALEGTLEEYRLSSTQWREEIESTKVENNDLRRTVNALRAEMEDGIRGRQSLRAKFDQLQEEMISASQSLAQDQSLWRTEEEEHKVRCEQLIAKYEHEKERRCGLENEVVTLSENLKADRDDHHRSTAHYERQLHDQKEVARLERDRMQKKIDDESKRAASELNSLRSGMENRAADLESQLDHATKAASTERIRHEQHLQEAAVSAAAALQERQEFHDQVVKELKQQHAQVLQVAGREKQHIELQNSERLALVEEKVVYYSDKIRHLEEKLEIAKSAAQAAVQAAQSKQMTSGVSGQPGSSAAGSIGNLPEKTSPQALRESILVLQEQLQDRESQIEQLEQRLAAVDMDAPPKCKAQETEIAWLRELLDVRVDDLEALIAALAQPVHDREAIKDAAIRLKANIQMEQQEKERAQSGVQSFAFSASISNLTSSPRSFPLAAAAAWGNWRRGRNAPGFDLSAVANNHAAETPSRISPWTQTILPGLLTPPRTDIRGSTHLSGGSKTPTPTPTSLRKRQSAGNYRQSSLLSGQKESFQRSSPPMTPSLTRKASYDADASSAEVDEMHDTANNSGTGPDIAEEEPFGPCIAAFAEHDV
ncbi:MAG: hypothetical protein Q9179_002899 [Wetmoreana sp. 5 TL-2023]